jgi:hypothetical protein
MAMFMSRQQALLKTQAIVLQYIYLVQQAIIAVLSNGLTSIAALAMLK